MDEEIEVKFLLADLHAYRQKLSLIGAELVGKRVFEYNLRFDRPDGSLAAARQILRLRQDEHACLTFKGPGIVEDEVLKRTEIEFEVSDFSAAQRFLEILGYQVFTVYEKYRQTWLLDGVAVSVDEMPYGCFTELEGPDGGTLKKVAEKLDLDWKERINQSYLALLSVYKLKTGNKAKRLTFADFEGVKVNPEDLGLHSADKQR